MRGYDRDLIRGGHYGQRSCEPHLKAEHMAAPTNLQREILLANPEPSTHGTVRLRSAQDAAIREPSLIIRRIVRDRTLRAWLHAHAGGAGFTPPLDSYSQPSAELVILVPETSHFFHAAFLKSKFTPRHCTP